jgi:hypothetical protein
MKKFLTAIILTTVSSCQFLSPQQTLSAPEHLGLVTSITDRVDVYVDADTSLTADEVIATHAKTNDFLLLFQVDGDVSAKLAYSYGVPIISIHDQYVTADPKLLPVESEIYLQSSELLLENIKLALE